jgi:hypothetical protein
VARHVLVASGVALLRPHELLHDVVDRDDGNPTMAGVDLAAWS